jgi:hypothetical protein
MAWHLQTLDSVCFIRVNPGGGHITFPRPGCHCTLTIRPTDVCGRWVSE